MQDSALEHVFISLFFKAPFCDSVFICTPPSMSDIVKYLQGNVDITDRAVVHRISHAAPLSLSVDWQKELEPQTGLGAPHK